MPLEAAFPTGRPTIAIGVAILVKRSWAGEVRNVSAGVFCPSASRDGPAVGFVHVEDLAPHMPQGVAPPEATLKCAG